MNRRIKKEVETATEYILPDYMGDIKKILMCRHRMTPTDSYRATDTLEINGGVEYTVIYADAENRLGSINLNSDFAVSIPDIADEYAGSEIYPSIENMSLRVLGPRKIAVRANAIINLTLTEDRELEVMGDGFEKDTPIEKSVAVINVENNRYAEDKREKEIAYEIERIPGLSGEDIEIIGGGGTVKIEGIKTGSSGVEVSGVLLISAIVKTPNQPPFRISKEIPFNEQIDIELREGESVSPTVYIGSLTLNESDDAEDKIITANATLEICVSAKGNLPLTVVKDAYYLEYECENVYSDFEYSTLLTSKKEECEIETTLGPGEIGCEGIHSVLEAAADIKDLSIQNSDGAVKILANICFSGIACEINEDESITYYSIKKTVPFEKNVNISCQNLDKTAFSLSLGESFCEGVVDGDNISLTCSFEVVVDVLIREKITCLSSYDIKGDIPPHTKSVITIYYPTSEDTLFDIAKRFHITVGKLCEDNSIIASVSSDEASALFDIKSLIIK